MSKPPMVFDPASHTGAGRSKRRPPPRPAKDSLPRHTCEKDWCGKNALKSENYPGIRGSVFLSVHPSLVGLRFCSWGCAGRFCAIQEVRQP